MNFHQLSGLGATLTLGLTFLSNLNYSYGQVADVFPPEVKKWVSMISAFSTIVLMTMHVSTSQSKPPAPPSK